MTAERVRRSALPLVFALIVIVGCTGCNVVSVRPVFEYFKLEDEIEDGHQNDLDLDFKRAGLELAFAVSPGVECFLFYHDAKAGPNDTHGDLKGEFYGIGARTTSPMEAGMYLDWSARIGRLDMEKDDHPDEHYKGRALPGR